MWNFILAVIISGSLVSARSEYRVCQPSSVIEQLCDNLKQGNSKVKCVKVLDGVDCILKLVNNEVDFGVLTGDELFLAYQFYPTEGMSVLHELRHRDKSDVKYQTEMVALVSVSHPNTGNNFQSLRDRGLCHPGFLESQILNDYVLKQFERKVYGNHCKSDLTDSENELVNLKNFFGRSCRPGNWVPNKTLDDTLKKRYPELCSLCDNESSCSYYDQNDHGHIGALKCLQENRGQVAYVALNHVRDYVDSHGPKVTMFQLLCPDGTIQPLQSHNPCSWIKRPWDVIISRNLRGDLYDFPSKLSDWLNRDMNEVWIDALRRILLGNNKEYNQTELPNRPEIGRYLGDIGGILDPPENPVCGEDIKWCTTSELENNKCLWIANETTALGITPKIVCRKEFSTFECLRSISEKRTDLATIDSNYGYVARKLFNLSPVLYADNDNDKMNVVLAVVPDSSSWKFKSLQDLKGKKACFPEYGGISWMTFINIVRANKVHEDLKTCDFKKIASDIFSKACVPGISDSDHSTLQKFTKANVDALCALCPENNCRASNDNPFFRDNGAFRCIEQVGNAEPVGDIAFVKPKNLNDSTAFLNQHKYRVLCKNGSLAIHTGFHVDEHCAWSVTIDSEVVSRKDISQTEHSNMALTLLKLHEWLGSNFKSPIPIHLYKSYNGTEDLLFKDSTVGLESSESNVYSVIAYKKLMIDAEKCSSASLGFVSLLVLILSLIANRVL